MRNIENASLVILISVKPAAEMDALNTGAAAWLIHLVSLISLLGWHCHQGANRLMRLALVLRHMLRDSATNKWLVCSQPRKHFKVAGSGKLPKHMVLRVSV